jgi:hypothetical protein
MAFYDRAVVAGSPRRRRVIDPNHPHPVQGVFLSSIYHSRNFNTAEIAMTHAMNTTSLESVAAGGTDTPERPSDAAGIIQPYGQLAAVRLGLHAEVRHKSVSALNRMLAHTLALRDLYNKNHCQTSGATFYQLHRLFDKHFSEQDGLADAIAERVQTLGGVALATEEDVSRESRISRVLRGREAPQKEL